MSTINSIKLKDYMTPSPKTINAGKDIKFAYNYMLDNHIRHLPVLDGGKLVGIISDRDIKFITSFDELKKSDILVEEACTDTPYQVDIDTPIGSVCQEMTDNKYSSTLVMEDGKLAGIFTWIDALKIISKHTDLQ
jgi:acetoin utilization protein AcuB